MLFISAKDTIEFTPDYYEDKEKAPVYRIAVPTIIGRSEFRKSMIKQNANYISDEEMMNRLREGVRTVIKEKDRPYCLDLIDQYESTLPDVPDDVRKEISELEEQVRNFYQPYTDAIADRDFYQSILPAVAATHFLKGWDNLDATFEQENGRATIECLSDIPGKDLAAIGIYIMLLLSLGADQVKKFVSPSGVPSTPATSQAGGHRKTVEPVGN